MDELLELIGFDLNHGGVEAIVSLRNVVVLGYLVEFLAKVTTQRGVRVLSKVVRKVNTDETRDGERIFWEALLTFSESLSLCRDQ